MALLTSKLQIPDLFSNVTLVSQGRWTVGNVSAVSYPGSGNFQAAQLEEKSFWFNHRKNFILDQFSRIRPPGKILDVGGGNGYMSLALQNAGYDVILIEPGDEGIELAQHRGVVQLVHAAFNDLAIVPGTLPSVALFDVLEHIDDDLGFLKDLKMKMATGSRLYISVPAYNFLWSSVDAHSGHFRRYSVRGLRRKLIQAGFDCEFATYFFSPLVVPLFLTRVIPNLIGRNRGSTEDGAKDEHLVKKSRLQEFLNRILRFEMNWFMRGHALFTGTSCWIIARKLS